MRGFIAHRLYDQRGQNLAQQKGLSQGRSLGTQLVEIEDALEAFEDQLYLPVNGDTL